MSPILLRRKKRRAVTPIAGNEWALHRIMHRTKGGIIKVEGRHPRWGIFRDVIEISGGKIVAHTSYAPCDFLEYEQTKATLHLHLDNIDVGKVIRYTIAEQKAKEGVR